jgi:cytochrome c oxidase assembly factor CtaG
VENVSTAALDSWSFSPAIITLLVVTAGIYVRGWLRLQTVLRSHFPAARLVSFCCGLLLLFIALESPLDAFASLLLEAHMVQHLLFMMVIPPLILYGQPLLPMLRGLPRPFVKHGLGPFLRWPGLQKLGAFLVTPVFAWFIFNVPMVAWHFPALYELTLHSPAWHDVEHATFFWTAILFWWPVMQPWPSKPSSSQWAIIPYLLLADVVNTALSASFVFSDKVIYPSYAAAPFASISPHEDQMVAGAIMWVPGSFIYLIPAVILAMRLLSRSPQQYTRERARPAVAGLVQISSKPGFDLLRTPVVGKFLKWRRSRPAMQTVMLLAAAAVIADGFLGPRMAPMNLAGVAPWIHWRAILVLALLIGGNFFCMACPFMLPRELARRIMPAKWRWPAWLRSKWLSLSLVALYLWSYEAFNLWNSPALTAWIAVGYFVAAFVVDGFFSGASFCKYVCPIGQFNFVSSLVSPLEVKVREQKTCEACETYDCIRGNAQQRGCELYLFQPKKSSNLDCTFCLDCIHACPHDNVGILPVAPASTLIADPYRSSIGRLSRRLDIAALALVISFGAFANAAGMIAPVAAFEGGLLQAIPRPVLIGGLALAFLVALPAALVYLCVVLNRAAAHREVSSKQLAASFALTLVPVGFAMWCAHLAYHLGTGWFTAVPVIQRAWTALWHIRTAVDWSASAYGAIPGWLRPLQISFLDAGLLLTLYIAWRTAQRLAPRLAVQLRLFAPWCVVACGLYIVGIWILFQPMQMRGTMMMH